MQIKLRHVEQSESKAFDEGPIGYVESLIGFIERSGGVYYEGSHQPFNSYQLVLDESGAYAEIIIGHDLDEPAE